MKKLILATSSFILGVIPFAALAQNYSDRAIEYVTEQQIMFTTGGGNFDEQGPVSRLEFTMAVVARFYDNADLERCFDDLAPSYPAFFTHLFPDVDTEEWYAQRLCVAMRVGLVQGYSDGTFRPFAAINAAEASKILSRAYGIADGSEAQWYAGPMAAMRLRGAVSGATKPGTGVRRADMARMFYAMRDEIPVGARPAEEEDRTEEQSAEEDGLFEIEEEEPFIANEQDDCPIARVNSPGTALLMLGIEARPRILERRSHRVMLQQAEEAYRSGSTEGPDGGSTATNLLERCSGAFVRTPGGGLMFTGTAVPRAVTEHIPHRILRAAAQNRREIEDPRINRNVGY